MRHAIPRLLLLLACGFPLCGPVHAQAKSATSGHTDTSRYRRFLAYPHQQRGYAAMRAGRAKVAIAEFEHARDLAPRSIDTALDLSAAYRRFGQPDKARRVLDRQAAFTPHDPRLRAAYRALETTDCRHGNSDVCRAERGFADLRAGHLDAAEQELAAAEFARSREGLALRRALVQRSIHLHAIIRAERQLAALDRDGALRPAERRQWFVLLLRQGQVQRARELQKSGGLDTPRDTLALAQALSAQGDIATLADYMRGRTPAFEDAGQERQWLFLLARVDTRRPRLLLDYRPRTAAGQRLHTRLALPVAMTVGDRALARHLLQRLPVDAFRAQRFTLALQAGAFDEALRQASAMLAAKPGGERLDELSYRLLQAGAATQAQQLLMDFYPFAGDPHASALMSRLALLASSQPALFGAPVMQRLRQPLSDPGLRRGQLDVLVALADCDGLRRVVGAASADTPASAWMALGDCYAHGYPGLAEMAYAQAQRQGGGPQSTRALAYQAYATHDLATSLEAWRHLDTARMRDADLLAGATTALAADASAQARIWLDAYAARGTPPTDRYWWLRARAEPEPAGAAARADLRHAIALKPQAVYYTRLAQWEQEAGHPGRALEALREAQQLSPQDAALAAQLGYAYLREGDPGMAAEQLERAHHLAPDDPALVRQLVYLNQQLGDRDAARQYAALAIDRLDTDPADTPEVVDQRFALRRLHEDLGRHWQFGAHLILGDNVSSAANPIAPGVAYRSYFQADTQYRFDTSLTGNGDVLAAYARVFSGSGPQGDPWPSHVPMLGAGLRWQPWRRHLVLFSIEQQVPLDHSPDTRTDTMLRVSASTALAPRFSDDWHASGDSWIAQNVYLDAARYLRAKQTAVTLDYRLGWHRKLGGDQTIEPYAHLQFNGLDRPHGQGFAHDLRAGAGVQWNLWYGEDRYDAFRHRFSVGLEYQHAFTSYLHERNAVYLTVGTQW